MLCYLSAYGMYFCSRCHQTFITDFITHIKSASADHFDVVQTYKAHNQFHVRANKICGCSVMYTSHSHVEIDFLVF
jgi:hypothetical protein